MHSLFLVLGQTEVDPLQALVSLFQSSSAAFSAGGIGGILLGIATIVYGSIKILRLGKIQDALGKISPKLVWANWPKPVCTIAVFFGAGAVALTTALVAGSPWLVAIPAAIVAGFTAMGVDAGIGAVAKPGASNPQ